MAQYHFLPAFWVNFTSKNLKLAPFRPDPFYFFMLDNENKDGMLKWNYQSRPVNSYPLGDAAAPCFCCTIEEEKI